MTISKFASTPRLESRALNIRMADLFVRLQCILYR